MTSLRPRALWKIALLAAAWPVLANAQTEAVATGALGIPESQQPDLEGRLAEIRALKQDLARQKANLDAQMGQLDSRIGAIETELGAATTPSASSPIITLPDARVERTSEPHAKGLGDYEFGKGFVLARGDLGELDFGLVTYARYLNQRGLDQTYTDSFGRTNKIDRREDAQLAKVTMTFKGWMFDPNFRYLVFIWTSNATQGQGAQVAVAGNLSYTFNKHFTLLAGIGALPTQRSLMYTYPNWLRVDNRTIADEFYKGGYSSGIWAQGEIVDRLNYRVMLANNLSTLGVDAGQLDPDFSTVSGALWWMPTTGEYGPAMGYGDFENHQQAATLFGVAFTRSPEDAEAQPGVNDFENAQLRLSDGTRLFAPNAFNTGGQVTQATYHMLSMNAGVKYRGWTLDGEYYQRWIDDLTVLGNVPVDKIEDKGFQVQASTMLIPKTLQAYASGSMIFGDYGDPSDLAFGVNYFPLKRREVRVNVQALHLDRSPVGYLSVPAVVGGKGWVLTTDFVLAF